MDEPTVVGRRPVGPTRNNLRPGQSPVGVAPMVAPPPAPAAAPAAARAPMPVAEVDDRGAASGEMVAQIVLEPKGPDDALVAAAAPLFLVVAQLRNIVENADINALRRRIVEQLRRFEERAVKNQARGGDVSAARYVMCALIDEAVMTTPWGSGSAWSDNSLLNQFHNETWGGEKVFQILDRVQAEPAKYVALLKLIDVCLLMGFEGKYRVVDGGRERLEDLRAELHRLLRQHTPSPPAELSTQWRGTAARTGVRNYVPLWIVFTAAALLVLIGYSFFRWRLSGELAPVEQMLDLVGRAGPR
jgi:type VI secretion system protein ImpK